MVTTLFALDDMMVSPLFEYSTLWRRTSWPRGCAKNFTAFPRSGGEDICIRLCSIVAASPRTETGNPPRNVATERFVFRPETAPKRRFFITNNKNVNSQPE